MGQVPQPHALARPKAPPRPEREKREGDDDHYRRAIKCLPCCTCCEPPPSDPHHLKCAGHRGAALRSPDRFAVPLCRGCHDEVENAGSRNEEKWFADRDVDCLMLARQLWGAWLGSATVEALGEAFKNHEGPS